MVDVGLGVVAGDGVVVGDGVVAGDILGDGSDGMCLPKNP